MNGNGKTVCMISCMHDLFDDRIYWKECLSLKKSGYTVFHIGFGKKDRAYVSKEGVNIIEVFRERYFVNPYLDKLFRIVTIKKNPYRKIFIAAKDTKADIYHTHDLQIGRLNKNIKSLSHKPKLIYDVHEYYPDVVLSYFRKTNPLWIVFKLYSFYIKAWEIKKSKSADYIIAAYPKIEGHFQKYLKNKPNTIIYNFTTLVPKQNKGIEKKYDVIYIGAINKNRGIFEIVRTADILKKQGRNLKFLVLGPFHNKKLESQVKNLIAKLGLQNCIELHKPVAYLKVEEFLAQSRIALSVFLPVSVYFYAVQIKTFEYMANGLPIVCSNFGTVKTFVEESNSGIPVNPLKPVEIANAIAYLCDNPDKYSEMSDNGIEAVQNVFNWEQMETKLLNIYSKLLK